MNLFTKQNETHRLKVGAFGCLEEGCEEGIVREFGMGVYTLLFLEWTTGPNKGLLYAPLPSLPNPSLQPWKSYLPQNRSLVPKRRGTAAIKYCLWPYRVSYSGKHEKLGSPLSFGAT